MYPRRHPIGMYSKTLTFFEQIYSAAAKKSAKPEHKIYSETVAVALWDRIIIIVRGETGFATLSNKNTAQITVRFAVWKRRALVGGGEESDERERQLGLGTLVTLYTYIICIHVFTATEVHGVWRRRVKVRWEPLSPGNTRPTTPTQPVSFRNPRRRRPPCVIRFFFSPLPISYREPGIDISRFFFFCISPSLNRKPNGKIIIAVYYALYSLLHTHAVIITRN